jgi:hypothetical protein
LRDIVQEKVQVGSIISASKDGIADGVLYDKTKIGDVVKADLVTMVARHMGIVSETVELPKYEKIMQPDGRALLLARARAKATHLGTGAYAIRSATVPMDFKRMEKEAREETEGRTLADRVAESCACRRAELALMGIPEGALINMVKQMIISYKKGVAR